MTGQGGSSLRRKGLRLDIWIRSLNHRFFECSIRCPPALAALEPAIQERLRELIRRGRIEVEIQTDAPGAFQAIHVDRPLALRYQQLAEELGAGGPLSAYEILRLPGVVSITPQLPAHFPERLLFEALDRAGRALLRNRRKEGAGLVRALRVHLQLIVSQLREIAARRRNLQRRDRRASMAAGEEGAEPERSEIQEEIERLQLHLSAFHEVLRGGPDAGKRADFVAQEMLREANTIAAKSRDFSIRNAVVEIKTALENIREQARNLC
ncbi:MAG: DUF1732 domain-containing protein [Leptospirales bacterium]|nr:DUF1732 domain-containing protein [Leptospirales bacterium]